MIRATMDAADVIIRAEDGRLTLPIPADWRIPR